MPLRPGTRLGPYEIAAQIGAGEMREVYLSRLLRNRHRHEQQENTMPCHAERAR